MIMKSYIRPIIALSLLSCSSVTFSRDIKIIGSEYEPNRRSLVLMDADTVRRVGPFIRFWRYMGIKSSREIPVITEELAEVDCTQERTRELKVVFRKTDLSALGEGDDKPWVYPSPSTHPYIAMQVVCGRKQLPTKNHLGNISPLDALVKVVQSIR